MLAFNYVEEYQQRGLPHALIFHIVAQCDRLKTPEDINFSLAAVRKIFFCATVQSSSSQ